MEQFSTLSDTVLAIASEFILPDSDSRSEEYRVHKMKAIILGNEIVECNFKEFTQGVLYLNEALRLENQKK